MLVGAIDVATERVETPEEVADVIRSALRFVPAARLLPCTNCGMVPLSRDVARGKLRALGAGRRTGPARIDVLTAVEVRTGAFPNPASGAGFRATLWSGPGRKPIALSGKTR